MTFKQAIKLLQQAEKRGRALEPKLNACRIQWDNMQEVIAEKYGAEWDEYCRESGLAPGYDFNDALC